MVSPAPTDTMASGRPSEVRVVERPGQGGGVQVDARGLKPGFGDCLDYPVDEVAVCRRDQHPDGRSAVGVGEGRDHLGRQRRLLERERDDVVRLEEDGFVELVGGNRRHVDFSGDGAQPRHPEPHAALLEPALLPEALQGMDHLRPVLHLAVHDGAGLQPDLTVGDAVRVETRLRRSVRRPELRWYRCPARQSVVPSYLPPSSGQAEAGIRHGPATPCRLPRMPINPGMPSGLKRRSHNCITANGATLRSHLRNSARRISGDGAAPQAT